MQLVLGLLLSCWLCLVTAYPTDPVPPECENMTVDRLANLTNLTVTEDVHDKMPGHYRQIWASRNMSDQCIKFTWGKVDDNEVTVILKTRPKNVDKTFRTHIFQKIENGVYVLKNSKGKAIQRLYELYNKQYVRAYFICPLEGTKAREFTGMAVRYYDLKTPLEADVQAEVDDVLKTVQDNKDLFGDLIPVQHDC